MINNQIVDFFIIGAMKSATTSLCDILSSHPEICVSNPKEPDFFCKEGADINDCLSAFSHAKTNQFLVDGSTSYTKSSIFKNVPTRLKIHNENAKFVYMLRDPIRRIESHWNHLASSKRTNLKFSEAIYKLPNIIETSLYFKQISLYLDLFDRSQILLIFFEDFKTDPEKELNRISEFFDIQKIIFADAKVPRHVSSQKKIDSSLLKMLQRIDLIRKIGAKIPKSKKIILDLMRKPNNLTPDWSEQDLEYVKHIIRPDAELILKFSNKSLNFWPSLA